MVLCVSMRQKKTVLCGLGVVDIEKTVKGASNLCSGVSHSHCLVVGVLEKHVAAAANTG